MHTDFGAPADNTAASAVFDVNKVQRIPSSSHPAKLVLYRRIPDNSAGRDEDLAVYEDQRFDSSPYEAASYGVIRGFIS